MVADLVAKLAAERLTRAEGNPVEDLNCQRR